MFVLDLDGFRRSQGRGRDPWFPASMSVFLGEPEKYNKDDEGQIYSFKNKKMDEFYFHAYAIRVDKEMGKKGDGCSIELSLFYLNVILP